MNLNHLLIFDAIATAGSVSKAAERLMVSQPAVSKQLKQLERTLRLPLFDRLPKGVRPTEAGELLAGYARRIFAIEAEAGEALDELRGVRRGRLSIGASTTIGVYLLPEIFVRFRKAHPHVRISLELANARAIERRLADGTIDIGFTEVPADSDTFDVRQFYEDRLVAITYPSNVLAAQGPVPAAVLCRQPFVVHEPASGTKSQAERALAEMGLTVTRAMALGSTEAIKRAVAAGVGVALVSGLTITLELRAGTLAALDVPDLCVRRPLHRVALRGRHLSPAVKSFAAMVDQQFQATGSRRCQNPDA